MNCWEFKNCGRAPGGANEAELGVCPAYSLGAGQACWLVAGTFCGGRAQGTFAKEQSSCLACDFYKRLDPQHRSAMRLKFGQFVLSKLRAKEYLQFDPIE